MKIYLGISTYNRKDLLERCLGSLKGSRQYISKLIVVDNGSQGIQHELIDELIWNETNLGYTGGTNQILQEAKNDDADWCLILNDDITVVPDFMKKLLPLLELCKEKWLLTPDWEWACIAFSKEGIKNLEFKPGQWLDEQFWPGYYSDNDLHWRIKCTGREAEVLIGGVPELTPWIKEKSKTKELAPELNHLAAMPLYIKKWGGLPGRETEKTPYGLDYKKIPIFIISRDRLTCLKDQINAFISRGYHNIHIIDNASSYAPLLDFYKTLPDHITIHYMDKNYGHTVFGESHLFNQYGHNYYALTDSDVIVHEDCPDNFMEYFFVLLHKYTHRGHEPIHKVGFGLKLDDLPDTFHKKQEVLNWEGQFWDTEAERGCFFAPIDTTFGLCRPGFRGTWSQAIRTDYPYIARHTGWYINSADLPPDERYYKDHITTTTHWTHQNE